MTHSIVIDPRLDFCARHLEPFRVDWPRGYPIMATVAFTAFTALPEVQRYAQLRLEHLPAAMREFGPICCAIGDALMAEITDVALHHPEQATSLVARLADRPVDPDASQEQP